MENTIEEKRIITENVELLKWYFSKDKNILDDEGKNKIFALLSLSIYEDPFVFLRIFKYITNTRKTDEQEIIYKILIHFMGILIPDIIMANIDEFIQLGKKDDVLYYLQCSPITKRISRWIDHKAKQDSDFKSLYAGELIKSPINRVTKYKLKDNNYTELLENILDDSNFNNIQI